MSEYRTQASADREVPPGTVVAILPQHVEQYWAAVEGLLRTVESWTQCLSADDIHPRLLDGRMQLWSVVASGAKSVFALTHIVGSARGRICTLWLIATNLSDDTTVTALIDRCEAVAKLEGCCVLEMHVFPWFADRISGKVTSATVERDIRCDLRKAN